MAEPAFSKNKKTANIGEETIATNAFTERVDQQSTFSHSSLVFPWYFAFASELPLAFLHVGDFNFSLETQRRTKKTDTTTP